MVKGQCNCGSVSFEIDAQIAEVFVCHCSACRKYTGNNGVAVVVVANNDFRWVSGAENVTNWVMPAADWQSSFCRICGSSMPVKNDECHMAVPAGSIIEGGESLRVTQHIWVDSKAAWDEIGDTGSRHGESFKA